MEINKNTCWYKTDSIQEMNRFYETYRGNEEVLKHLETLLSLLRETDVRKVDLLDLGCGTAMLSEYVTKYEYNYFGADMPEVLNLSAKKFHPNYFYRDTFLETDDLSWISRFEIVVMNAVIDVMEHPLEILDKVLSRAKNYVLIHRQELTENGDTRVALNPSYGDNTYHSIIKKADLQAICDKNDFDMVCIETLYYTNWEGNGNSFLLKKRKKWDLNDISNKIYTKYFFGKTNLVYLEAGSNDGLTQSNTMFFEHYKGWSGILIEPSSECFEKLKQNRSDRNKFYHCALVSNEYNREEIEFIYTPENRGMLSVVHDENSQELLKRCKNELKILEYVKAKTLNNVLEDANMKIDIMFLDVEGQEKNILKGVDFDKHLIDYILVEELEENEDINEILKSHYERIDKITEHDYLYKRK